MNKQNIVKAMPTVLFVTGIVGIFVSEVMAARDTLKAEKIIEEKSIYRQKDIICDTPDGKPVFVNKSFKEYAPEVIKATWKCYIPTALSTTITITSLVMSKRLTQKQMLALSTAVASAGGLVGKYRKAILERTDPNILSEIDKEVAEAVMEESHPPVIETGHLTSTGIDDMDDGSELYLFFDPFTKMKFRTTKLCALGAKYYINRNFSLGSEVPLSMYYMFLGLELPEEYRQAGWDIEAMAEGGYFWIDIDYVRSDKPDPETGEYYYIIEYDYLPGDVEDNYYPFGNPLTLEGSIAK
jgi:hypothetical protein